MGGTEDLGGDPACWAHLVDEGPETEPAPSVGTGPPGPPGPPGQPVEPVDEGPSAWPGALVAMGRCAVRVGAMVATRRLRQPSDRVGERLSFADGSSACVYRETTVTGAAVDQPAMVVVGFRLRWAWPWVHPVFRVESVLNTVLFAGFPGFVSKLWLTDDQNGVYRGVYQWDGEELARRYVRALWWALAVVSSPRSIHWMVLPGFVRDEVLEHPALLGPTASTPGAPWWRPISDEAPAR